MKIKNKSHWLFLLLWIQGSLIFGCKDFIEPSLKEKKVTLIAPVDHFETTKYNITFWWEALEDALQYRVQVVSPDFNRPGTFILDTVVKGKTTFNVSLDPGVYQWRVRAENGSSVSAFTVNHLLIHESSIAEQKVILKVPANETLTNNAEVRFGWERLFGAELYRIQIDTLGFSDENKLVFNQTTASTDYLFSFSKDGSFKWRVRAEKGTQQSRWSDIYSLTLDRAAPAKVILTAPANNAMISKPVRMQWQAVPTAKKYRLYVYKSDQTSPYNPSFPMVLTGTEYTFNTGEVNDKIYWRVLAIDQAGNEGEYSDLLNFTIQ